MNVCSNCVCVLYVNLNCAKFDVNWSGRNLCKMKWLKLMWVLECSKSGVLDIGESISPIVARERWHKPKAYMNKSCFCKERGAHANVAEGAVGISHVLSLRIGP